ncbi:MAG: polysaccharide deacetylase family protein, partial [Proteobacteria bacterium]|nr:polysaccharide deacetylase family protein [Pseudomonadota bacterium]
MSGDRVWDPLMRALDDRAGDGRVVRFWLRDDDAVAPSPALDRLLDMAGGNGVPLILAVIPAPTGEALARRLEGCPGAAVALHGWSHRNHAGPGEKSQELGPHRPVADMLAELRAGQEKLSGLHGRRFLPLLVPPWNRIDPALLPHLGAIGLMALSVFGPEQPGPAPEVNCHVDLIDWRGNRGGRDPAALVADILARLGQEGAPDRTVGILGHHLVHDAAAWAFLHQLL